MAISPSGWLTELVSQLNLLGEMNERLDIDFTRIGRKWVCYFDLLGFSELLKQSIVNAFFHWELCLGI